MRAWSDPDWDSLVDAALAAARREAMVRRVRDSIEADKLIRGSGCRAPLDGTFEDAGNR